MTKADDYNVERVRSGAVTPADLTLLVAAAQRDLGVRPDGFAGPVTIEALRPAQTPSEPLAVDKDAWLEGSSVASTPITHVSWRGGPLKTPNSRPLGIVVHTSDTVPGTALNMARRRARPFGQDADDRMSSWHISIEANGDVHQMIALTNCAWHAGSPSARKLPFGWANYCTVGIELISPDDKNFPAAQIEAAKRTWRAIIRWAAIPRDRAMIAHGSFEDPNRRVDPGVEWMGPKPWAVVGVAHGGHAKAVLDYAYG